MSDPGPPSQTSKVTQLTYVVITPARNEADYIEHTLRSMVAQTVRPLRWVIVSDGSTDATDDIVMRYTAQHDWISLLRMPERSRRDFAGKVRAFNAGLDSLAGQRFDAICSLDADLSFLPDHFEFLLGKLASDPGLGLVGTPFQDEDAYDYRFVSLEHVSGACQLFTRRCFSDVGGYVPMPRGGIDHAAVITARMKGWRTKTYTERVCLHYRRIGSASSGRIAARFRDGQLDYALGGHPLWELFRSLYQMSRRPRVFGGLAVLSGYMTAAVARRKRPVSADFVAFRRREQMTRLKTFLFRRASNTRRSG